MSSIIDIVRNNLIEYSMISDGDSVLVGLSGGADSVMLLTALYALKDENGFKLSAAHVNHGIRGESAKMDCAFCENLCEKLNIPFHKIFYDIPLISKELKTSEENAGRIKRYEYFNELSKTFGYNKIAVAHNMNDSVETVIMNMIRGSSLNGLCGIKPVNKNVVRPIYNISREEIEKYLSDHDINYRIDETNLLNDYNRNKIRNNVLKEMSQINPSVVKTIFSNLGNLRQDDEYISNRAKLLGCVKEENGDVIIDKNIYDSEDISIKKRIIFDAYERITGSLNNLESKHIDILTGNLSSGKKYDMPSGLTVYVSFDKIIFSKDNKKPIFLKQTVIPDCVIKIFDRNIKFSFSENPDFRLDNTLNVDFEKIKGNLILRSRIEGDRFIPFGMNGSKKLKQFLCELKIPSHKRDEIPILCDDEGIVGVIPYRIADRCKITHDTRKVLKIQILKEN